MLEASGELKQRSNSLVALGAAILTHIGLERPGSSPTLEAWLHPDRPGSAPVARPGTDRDLARARASRAARPQCLGPVSGSDSTPHSNVGVALSRVRPTVPPRSVSVPDRPRLRPERQGLFGPRVRPSQQPHPKPRLDRTMVPAIRPLAALRASGLPDVSCLRNQPDEPGGIHHRQRRRHLHQADALLVGERTLLGSIGLSGTGDKSLFDPGHRVHGGTRGRSDRASCP